MFARELEVTPAFVSQLLSGMRPVPIERCVQIEQLTAGAVRRWDLRPQDWWRIWPELVGMNGAPTVERPADPERVAA